MIKIGDRALILENFYDIIYNGEEIDLDQEALNNVQGSFDFLK